MFRDPKIYGIEQQILAQIWQKYKFVFINIILRNYILVAILNNLNIYLL